MQCSYERLHEVLFEHAVLRLQRENAEYAFVEPSLCDGTVLNGSLQSLECSIKIGRAVQKVCACLEGKNSGITVSGGEPLVQVDFVAELFRLAKEKGVHPTLDTAGNPFTTEEPFYSSFCKLMEYTDLVMLDLKHMDAAPHRELTGRDNANILELARWLSDHGKPMWIRRVLVPGISDDSAELKRCREFIDTLKTVERVEILPYHTLATAKWEQLGIPYPLDGVPTPTAEQVKAAEDILCRD